MKAPRLAAAARRGTSYGAPSALETELGETVRRLMPSIERSCDIAAAGRSSSSTSQYPAT